MITARGESNTKQGGVKIKYSKSIRPIQQGFALTSNNLLVYH